MRLRGKGRFSGSYGYSVNSGDSPGKVRRPSDRGRARLPAHAGGESHAIRRRWSVSRLVALASRQPEAAVKMAAPPWLPRRRWARPGWRWARPCMPQTAARRPSAPTVRPSGWTAWTRWPAWAWASCAGHRPPPGSDPGVRAGPSPSAGSGRRAHGPGQCAGQPGAQRGGSGPLSAGAGASSAAARGRVCRRLCPGAHGKAEGSRNPLPPRPGARVRTLPPPG